MHTLIDPFELAAVLPPLREVIVDVDWADIEEEAASPSAPPASGVACDPVASGVSALAWTRARAWGVEE